MDQIIVKEIPGFSNYKADQYGNIYRYKKGIIIPMKTYKYGNKGQLYWYVSLVNDKGERKLKTIHRLVLLAFKGVPADGLVACHNNGNQFDNRIENLRWDSLSSNSQDRKKHGTEKTGSSRKRLTYEQAQNIKKEYMENKIGCRKLGKKYGVSGVTVLNVINGRYHKNLPDVQKESCNFVICLGEGQDMSHNLVFRIKNFDSISLEKKGILLQKAIEELKKITIN